MYMSTFTAGSAHSRSITIAAAPARVVAYLGDPENLPVWAPDFAQAVRRTDEGWLVTSGQRELRLAIPVQDDAGTVDLVSAIDPRSGLFMRVVPNWDGSECVFTKVFRPGTSDDAVERQMAVFEAELQVIRSIVEAAA